MAAAEFERFFEVVESELRLQPTTSSASITSEQFRTTRQILIPGDVLLRWISIRLGFTPGTLSQNRLMLILDLVIKKKPQQARSFPLGESPTKRYDNIERNFTQRTEIRLLR